MTEFIRSAKQKEMVLKGVVKAFKEVNCLHPNLSSQGSNVLLEKFEGGHIDIRRKGKGRPSFVCHDIGIITSLTIGSKEMTF